MDNSTEELTPILVPFEKASGWRNNNPDSFNAKASEGMKTGDWSNPTPHLDNFVEKDWSKPTPRMDKFADKTGLSSATDNSVLGGTAMAANTLGSVATAAKTAGDATRKLFQGILNPGLMGQGAVAGGLEAADTIFSPNKEKQMAHNNLMDAAQISAQGKQMDAEKAQNAANEKTLQDMRGQAEKLLQDKMKAHGFADADSLNMGGDQNTSNPREYTEEQYAEFLKEYPAELGALVMEWKKQGVSEDLIDQVFKEYNTHTDNARNSYSYFSKEKQDQMNIQDAKDAEKEAMDKAQAAVDAYDRGKNNEDQIKEFIRKSGLSSVQTAFESIFGKDGETDVAGKNPLQLFHTMIRDGNGKTSTEEGFDPSTGMYFNLDDPRMSQFTDALKNASRHGKKETKKNAKAALSYLNAAKKSKELFDKATAGPDKASGVSKYLKGNLKKKAMNTSGTMFSDRKNNPVRRMEVTAAENILRFAGDDVSDDAVISFTKNGGLGTRDTKDLALLEKAKAGITKEINNNVATYDALKSKLKQTGWYSLTDKERAQYQKFADMYALKDVLHAKTRALSALAEAEKPDSTIIGNYINGMTAKGEFGLPGTVSVDDPYGTARMALMRRANGMLDSIDQNYTRAWMAIHGYGAEGPKGAYASQDLADRAIAGIFDTPNASAPGWDENTLNARNLYGEATDDVNSILEGLFQKPVAQDVHTNMTPQLDADSQRARAVINEHRTDSRQLEAAVAGRPNMKFGNFDGIATIAPVAELYHNYGIGALPAAAYNGSMPPEDIAQGLDDMSSSLTVINDAIDNGEYRVGPNVYPLNQAQMDGLREYATVMKANSAKWVQSYMDSLPAQERRALRNAAITEYAARRGVPRDIAAREIRYLTTNTSGLTPLNYVLNGLSSNVDPALHTNVRNRARFYDGHIGSDPATPLGVRISGSTPQEEVDVACLDFADCLVDAYVSLYP